MFELWNLTSQQEGKKKDVLQAYDIERVCQINKFFIVQSYVYLVFFEMNFYVIISYKVYEAFYEKYDEKDEKEIFLGSVCKFCD